MRNKLTRRKYLTAHMLVLPCTIVILLMMVYPLLQVFQFSFSEVKLPFFDATFVGLENFKHVTQTPEFGRIWINTLIWTFVSIAIRFVLGFAAALVMERGIRLLSVFRVILLLPWVVPAIVAAHTWRWIYNADTGLLNTFIRNFAPGFTVNWLGNSATALMAVIVTYCWMGFPFIMLMLIAGMQGIPNDYKEAAQIDGANAFKVFIHITLPCLKSVILILVVMEIISGFNAFDVLYTMTAGGPGGASEILGLFIYRTAFSNLNFSDASAVSVMLIIIMIICFIFYVPLSAKGRKE